MATTRGREMLSSSVQEKLIQQFQKHATVWCDNKGVVLRIFRVGPGRRDIITLQDGEFSVGSGIAQEVLTKGFIELQQPKYAGGGLEYTSLRSDKTVIRLTKDQLNELRASVSHEIDRPHAPQAALSQKLATVETIGGRQVTRLTAEGWDAMRLRLVK